MTVATSFKTVETQIKWCRSFSGTERKELSSMNSMSGENILQELGESKDISDEEELREFIASNCVLVVVQTLSCVWICDPIECSTPVFPVLYYLSEFAQTHVHWVSDAIQPFHPVIPFSICPQSFPASGSFSMTQLFVSGGQSIGASASVLPMNIQGWYLTGLVWSPCCPRDSQESSPAPQIESINSSAHSLLYGPTLTAVDDYWKNHSLDYISPP